MSIAVFRRLTSTLVLLHRVPASHHACAKCLAVRGLLLLVRFLLLRRFSPRFATILPLPDAARDGAGLRSRSDGILVLPLPLVGSLFPHGPRSSTAGGTGNALARNRLAGARRWRRLRGMLA